MKKFLVSLTAAACLGAAADFASAQYPNYASQAPAGYGAPQFAARQAVPQYGVRPAASVAMRPSTSTYAAQPASYQFKPVNPPSAATQRLLLASRNTPTPAPTPAPQSKQVPRPSGPPPQQYWNSGSNAQPWDASNAAPASMPATGAYGGGYSSPVANGGPVEGDVGGTCNDGTCGGGQCGTGCGGCCFLAGKRCCIPLRTTGDLTQHMPFFGTTHGYYYFHPYHVMHVFSQQELATRWGGDARNPYDNTMFQRVYEQMGVAAPPVIPPAAPTIPVPANVQEYVVPNGQSIVPTPMPSYMPHPQYAPGQQIVPQGNGPMPGVQPEYIPAR